jgi:hypothetical protein
MKITINHRQKEQIVVGSCIRVPCQDTNLFGETLEYTTLSVLVNAIVSTGLNPNLSYSYSEVYSTVVDGEFVLDLQHSK